MMKHTFVRTATVMLALAVGCPALTIHLGNDDRRDQRDRMDRREHERRHDRDRHDRDRREGDVGHELGRMLRQQGKPQPRPPRAPGR